MGVENVNLVAGMRTELVLDRPRIGLRSSKARKVEIMRAITEVLEATRLRLEANNKRSEARWGKPNPQASEPDRGGA